MHLNLLLSRQKWQQKFASPLPFPPRASRYAWDPKYIVRITAHFGKVVNFCLFSCTFCTGLPDTQLLGLIPMQLGKNIKHEKHYICDFLQQNRSFLKADFTYPRTDSCIECTSQKTSAVYPFKSYVEECSTISSVNIY